MTQPPYPDEPQPAPPGPDPSDRGRRRNRLVIGLIVAVAATVVAVPTLLVLAPLVLTRHAVPSPEAGSPSGVHGLAPGATAQPTPRRTPRATAGSTPTATGSDSPTPTPPPAASPPPKSRDSGVRYRMPKDFCKAVDLAPFRTVGLSDHTTDQSKIDDADFPRRGCAFPYNDGTIGGAVTVDAIFTKSTIDAGAAYDVEHADAHSRFPPSRFVDDQTVGSASYTGNKTVDEVHESFYEVGARDGTVVVIVGSSLFNATGPGTPRQQREMIDRLHRTARTVLASLR